MNDQHLKENFTAIASEFESVNDHLDNIDDKVAQNTASLLRIEQTIGVFKEAYEVNRDKNKELDQRVTKVETQLGFSS